MNLDLKRPLVFFDLETTGLDVAKDRIIEISLLRVALDNSTTTLTYRVNPTIAINPAASAVHGIYDIDVANEPTFKELGAEINEFLIGADMAGYNSNKFDLPMLVEEFMRVGIEFDLSDRSFVDVQAIFHRMEARTLEAALRFYCNKELVNAHSAEADTFATYEILLAQLDRYKDAPYKARDGKIEYPIVNDVEKLHEFSNTRKSADLAGFIGYDDKGNEIINFGKNKGKTVYEILETTPAYIAWVLNADFPEYTKLTLRKIKERYEA